MMSSSNLICRWSNATMESLTVAVGKGGLGHPSFAPGGGRVPSLQLPARGRELRGTGRGSA